ncbi:hypothetical protein CYMTET_34180 [Cymbomonas tetramitiformis]|uniref:Uncharacterized protein n=1 Tax=Cymbomonas tetramitiformis TaxID=36881 RepID=A0AAE0KQ78_9CHLO|nr:hypothetical protein CYMTET_34180 [Cymbomonas tetramitiformis]
MAKERGTGGQERAACVLSSLANGSTDRMQALFQKGIFDLLDHLLKHGTLAAKERAACTVLSLGNAGNHMKQEVMNEHEDIVVSLVALLKCSSPSTRSRAADALTCLANGKDSRKAAILEARVMPAVVHMIKNGTPSCRERAAGLMCSLCSGTVEQKVAVGRSPNVICEMVQMLQAPAQDNTAPGLENAVLALQAFAKVPELCEEMQTAKAVQALQRLAGDLTAPQGLQKLARMAWNSPLSSPVRLLSDRVFTPLLSPLGSSTSAASNKSTRSSTPISPNWVVNTLSVSSAYIEASSL